MIPRNGPFIIAIEFVPKRKCPNHGLTEVQLTKEGLPIYRVTVVRERREEQTQDTLAHEFGHVIASIFRTEASAKDPRFGSNRENVDIDTLNIGERCALYDAEREAWDFAIKIRPSVNRRQMRESLETYV